MRTTSNFFSQRLDTIGYNSGMAEKSKTTELNIIITLLILSNIYFFLAWWLNMYKLATYLMGLILLLESFRRIIPKFKLGMYKRGRKIVKKSKPLQTVVSAETTVEEIDWKDIALTHWWFMWLLIELLILIFYYFVAINFIDGKHGWDMFYLWE